MGKTFRLREFVIALLSLLIILGICYKLLEWQTLKSIAKIEVAADRQELAQTEEQSNLSNKIIDLFGVFINSKFTAEEQFKLFDELNGLVDQSINNQETYLETLKTNRGIYQKLNFRSKLLALRRGDFAKKYLATQDLYYQTEIESVEESLVSDALIKNLLSVMEDRVVMDEYRPNTPQYFSQVASLEKYTRNDFQFTESEKIRKLYPYGYEVLDNYKNYMASFYAVVRDEEGKDPQSAAYKRFKLAQTKLRLNIDFDKFFNEGEDRRRERGHKIITSTAQKVQLIKGFGENMLGTLRWREDLVQCAMYSYKTIYFNLITNEWPKAPNFNELLTELSQVAPKTDEVDGKFDQSIMKFSNSLSELDFECTDSEDGRVFTNLIKK